MFVGEIVTLAKGISDEKKHLKCPKMLQFRDEKKLDQIFPNCILLKICMSFPAITLKAAKNFLKLCIIKMIL